MARTIDPMPARAQGAAMFRPVCLLLLALLAGASPAFGQMQPHRAEYTLRLGAAANAPRIGTAVQDLSQDCAGWHLKRDITTEIALTAAWKMSLSSKFDAQEARSGNALRYRTVQVQNGNTREFKGRVQKAGNELRAEVAYPEGPPSQFTIPVTTLMPVAAIDHLIERLRAKAAAFPALMFDGEVINDVFLIDVTELDDGRLRGARPADKPVALPKGKSWPVFMTFTRGRQQTQRPLFSVTAQVFENGVLDRLTVETGLVTVTADLQSLEMRPAPNCPRA
jgi:hypothetical protein